jgi:TolB-like protein/tRNA A-37 threonylcarbamoyl transferase component Bud32/Tfp pilus assembly protein PilF
MECSKCQFDNPDATKFCGKCGAPLTADARMADSLTKTLATPLPVIAKDKLVAGKYRIIEEIGHGGMGVVYKAEDLMLKRCVALKFLPPHLADSVELKERFLNEARAAAALSHPNICVIHEVGESEGRPYIAMEFVEGETLRDKIHKGPLKSEEALAIVVQVASGLAEAHRKGIIHRDIKSANIMVTNKGQAKVMDFGLAKLRGGSSLTKSQTTLGTVAYMSPEQARGDDLDHRTDLWSLGVVLYEMLAGELPFKGDHDQTVIHAILHREPKPLGKTRPGLPPGLEEIVLQALAKNPADRYQTMEELREDLEAVAEGLKPLKAKRRLGRKIFGSNGTYFLSSVLAVLIILFGLNVGGFRDQLFGRWGRAEPAIKLAVLPFRNLMGDPAQEYLSDGITEELIAQLGRLNPQNLGVIGRTSVMRYKTGDTSIDQIGRDLDVNYVLEGSLQREAARVRINTELIYVSDRTQAWTGTYELELSGILAAQGQVAKGVAKALAVKLLPAEEARLAIVRMVNPEAYSAYLKGSALWKTMKKADLDAAQRFFDQAVEKDPSYAPAFSGLAWVWMARQQMSFVPESEGVPKAKEAALQAITLDEYSAEAHEALATVMTWGEWDWVGAQTEWTRTLELNPNGDNAHAYYAHYLAHRGRAAEGLRHSDLAIKLDPFNALNHALRGMVLLYLRRFDDAMTAARTAMSLRADLSIAFTVMQRAYMAKGMRDEQLADQRLRISRDTERVAAFERGLADGGYEGAQRGIADVLTARFERSQYFSASGIALRYLDAGDNDRAIDWLQKAYDRHDSDLPYINAPPWDRLRDDPRYQALLRRIGLPLDEKI